MRGLKNAIPVKMHLKILASEVYFVSGRNISLCRESTFKTHLEST